MKRELLRAKIHRITVTERDVEYEVTRLMETQPKRSASEELRDVEC